MYLSLIDFGLFILIWIVQLVIYPSFRYYEEVNLIRWHEKYTTSITIIVLPLMFSQLILNGLQLYNHVTFFNTFLFGLIVATWVITFLISVPLHTNISNNVDVKKSVNSLVRTNWARTFLWSLIVIIRLFS